MRLGAGIVIQNDEETVEKSLRSFYDYVDTIYVSNDPDFGWSGQPVQPDRSLEIIRSLDTEKKVQFLSGDFHSIGDPLENDTYQRQCTVDQLYKDHPDTEWILQVDADEEFLDFSSVIKTLQGLPPEIKHVYWNWIPVFNLLPDGRYLVVVNNQGFPAFEVFPLAHRPGTRLSSARYHEGHNGLAPDIFLGGADISTATLHFSYAKSEKRIREKLSTWGHSHQVDADAFFELWKRSVNKWDDIIDFHPLAKGLWPALKPFTRQELLTLKPPALPKQRSFFERVMNRVKPKR